MNEIRPTRTHRQPTCRWSTARRRFRAARNTRPTFLQPQTLAGRIFRSPYAHAEIVEVDISEALKLPGVRAIVTGQDCDKTFGVLPIARTEHPLARDKVRYSGEPVAAVAAIDDATAAKAIRLDQDEGEGAAGLFHREVGARGRRRAHCTRRSPAIIERDVLFELGNVEEGFAKADLVREDTYNCAEVCQNQMEMHAALAEYDARARPDDGACAARRFPTTCT